MSYAYELVHKLKLNEFWCEIIHNYLKILNKEVILLSIGNFVIIFH